jgi:hypothetical protein
MYRKCIDKLHCSEVRLRGLPLLASCDGYGSFQIQIEVDESDLGGARKGNEEEVQVERCLSLVSSSAVAGYKR